MSYSTFTNILPILPMLAQTDTSVGYTQTTVLIGKHILRADSLIDGKLARRYAVPFSGTVAPPWIRQISEDIVSYMTLVSTFGKDNINTFRYQEDFERAFSDLKMLREGEADLVNTAGSVVAEVSADSKIDSNTDTYTPTFGEDSSTSWVTDSDKLTDLDNARG